MKIRAAIISILTLSAAPALAQNYVEVYQRGQHNWYAGNQYNSRGNEAVVNQLTTGENTSNYASFAQQGRSNMIVVTQDVSNNGGSNENRIGATQTGYLNAFGARQTQFGGPNYLGLTQNRMSRR